METVIVSLITFVMTRSPSDRDHFFSFIFISEWECEFLLFQTQEMFYKNGGKLNEIKNENQDTKFVNSDSFKQTNLSI